VITCEILRFNEAIDQILAESPVTWSDHANCYCRGIRVHGVGNCRARRLARPPYGYEIAQQARESPLLKK
jgi:hypothetical protein